MGRVNHIDQFSLIHKLAARMHLQYGLRATYALYLHVQSRYLDTDHYGGWQTALEYSEQRL
jgi:hypothetical protein